MANNIAVRPPRRPARAKLKMAVLETEIPRIRATSVSWATALSTLPCLVLFKNQRKPNTIIILANSVTNSPMRIMVRPQLIVVPSICKLGGKAIGKPRLSQCDIISALMMPRAKDTTRASNIARRLMKGKKRGAVTAPMSMPETMAALIPKIRLLLVAPNTNQAAYIESTSKLA